MILHSTTEIIVLKAKGDAGKTTLLNDIINIMNSSIVPVYSIPTVGNDQIIVYANYPCTDGVTRNIAFITRGDSEDDIQKDYTYITSNQPLVTIDILVGACRTKGKTVDKWISLHSSIPCTPSINFITPHLGRTFWSARSVINAADLATARTSIKV